MRHIIFVLAILIPMGSLSQPTDKAVRSVNGMLVRVVGATADKDAAVIDDPDVGEVVEVVVDDNVLCNVVLYAKVVNRSEFYGDIEMVGTMPDVPGLDFAGGVMGVYMVPDSCRMGICAWNVMLRGDECRKVGSMPHFVASTLKEMWDLPSVRARLLVTDGLCGDKRDIPCTVLVGDSRAIPDKKVRFNHGWSGRSGDLGFRQRLKGQYLERVRPDRLDPDGKVIPRGVAR
jgi:hypothetical protein